MTGKRPPGRRNRATTTKEDMTMNITKQRTWHRAAAVAALALLAAVTACGTHGILPQAGGDSGGGYSLVQAQYPACQQQGAATAAYLATGQPTSDDPIYGGWRQQVLTLSGQQQQLAIRQYGDSVIGSCDQQQAQATAQAQAQATAQAQAQATAQAQAAQATAKQAMTPACTQVGGAVFVTAAGTPYCGNVPYYGTDGAVYESDLNASGTSLLTDPADAAGTSATPAECGGQSGHYAYGLCLAHWQAAP